MKNRNLILAFILVASLLLGSCANSASTTTQQTVAAKSVVASTNDIAVNKTQEQKKQASAPAVVQTARTFKIGDYGDEVKTIQKKLNKFGYNLAVDGSFGESTSSAVRDFQSKHKILVDGVVGEESLKMLDTSPTPSTMYTPAPQSASQSSSQQILSASNNSCEKFINSQDCPSETNDYILVNLPEQMVYIFSGYNHNWKMINSFECASGKSSTPTIKGHFSVGNKGAFFKASGGAICKYYTQIYGNYLFHSILYDSTGNHIEDGTLGTTVSHGCIRLAINNALYIYNNMPRGTEIWIR